MILQKTALAAGVLTLAGALAACGGSSSSSSTSAGGVTDAAASPTDASQADFCRTFTDLSGDVTPHEAATRLIAVGTPSGITGSARDGFVLLATHLFVLPDDSQRDDLESVAKDLHGSDQSDLIAFVTYYSSECSAVPSM